MRVLGLVLCGLLLTGCTGGGEEAPRSSAVTAAGALGDFRTLDYCSLMDPADGRAVSSYDGCTVNSGALRLSVGRLDDTPNPARTPYDYPGDLPVGVKIQQSSQSPQGACVRWVGFSDSVWLLTGASDLANPPVSPAEDLCSAADEVVGGVLASIRDKRVEHTKYGKDSFGSLDPCELIAGARLGDLVDADLRVEPMLSGHDCLHGHIGLSFSVGEPSQGTPETLAGRPVVVEATGVYCFAYVDRALPDRLGLVDQAKITAVAVDGATAGDGNAVCPDARKAAELVIPKLPA